MKKKPVFYCELSYLIGLLVLGLGCALVERSDFGLSMIVAPAYLIHLKVSQFLPFYSFGMSIYVFQAFLLVLLSLVTGKFKKHYPLSFVTAVIYGLILDSMVALIGLLPFTGTVWNVVFFVIGTLLSTFGVALLFHTYLPPEAYELFVKEFSKKFGTPLGPTKIVYDCCSCVLSIILSFAFFGFGNFVGIKWGTIICTFCNGWLIGIFSRWQQKTFTFKDALPLRKKIS